MENLSKTVYVGEDREGTLDWMIRNPRDQLCLGVYLFDSDLAGVALREAHGFVAVDVRVGVGVACGILPGEVLHLSARVSPAPGGRPCRVGLVYADDCLHMIWTGEQQI